LNLEVSKQAVHHNLLDVECLQCVDQAETKRKLLCEFAELQRQLAESEAQLAFYRAGPRIMEE
jgi:hypothetical protein